MRSTLIGILFLWGMMSGCDSKQNNNGPASANQAPSGSAPQTSAQPVPANPTTAQPTAIAGPKWTIQEASHDFGNVWTGRRIIHPFVIRNDGTAPLRLTKPKAYCSCSQASAYPEVIEPGKTGEIQFTLNLQNKSGPVHETLESTTNDPQNPSLKVTLTGIARTVCELELVEDQGLMDGTTPPEKAKEIAAYPPNFDRITSNQNLRRVIRMKNTSGEPIHLEMLPIRSAAIWDDKGQSKMVAPMFDAILNPLQEGEVYDLTIVGKPPFEPGNNITAIQFKTGIAEYPTYEVKATAFCPPRIEMSPYKIVFNQQASKRQRIVTFRNNGTTPFKITSIAVSNPDINVTLLPTNPSDPNLSQVEVLIPSDPAYLPPTYGEVIRIETNDPEMGTIDIQILPHMSNPATPRPADKPLTFTPGKILQ